MGFFIVLDGPDATGTTTHAARLAERFRQEGRDVVLTSEPTDGPVGKQIRDYLKNGEADPLELQMLFTSDRAWHVENVIAPALKAGKTVVCDRYWYSTIIYAEAQGVDAKKLRELNDRFVQPALVLFTLPRIEVSLQRLAKRESKEFFERDDFQRKIHAGYSRMAKENPSIRVIDTSGDKVAVAEEIWKVIKAS